MKQLKPEIAALFLILPFAAKADITIGIPTEGNTIPFSSDSYLDYQQVYASSAFDGPVTIESITFFNTVFDSGQYSLSPNNYSLFLSTTSVAVGGMSSDLADNVGADELLVFSGPPPANSLPGFGGEFVFDLLDSFSYDPSAGNLLLRVALDGRIDDDIFIGLDRDAVGSSVTGRSFGNEFGVLANSGSGLVTRFGIAEPRTVAEQLEELGAAVIGVGPGNSLSNKIIQAQAFHAAADTQAACAMLNALLNQVQAQRGKKLSAELADQLTEDAQAIIEAIGCD